MNPHKVLKIFEDPAIGRAFVINALKLQREGVKEDYNTIISILRGDGPVTQRVLHTLTSCVAGFEPNAHWTLVNTVLGMDWFRDPLVTAELQKFVLHLPSCNVQFLVPCMKMLVRLLLPKDDEDLQYEQTNCIHDTIQGLLQQFPTASTVLLPLLGETFPHKRMSARVHQGYLFNALRVLDYCPSLMEQLFLIVVDRLLQIDAELQVDDDAEEEEENEDDGLCFELELEDAEQAEQVELASKLDVTMDLCFSCITKHIGAGGPAADEVFRVLCLAFDRLILDTYKSKYTQFLIFHAAQYNLAYAEAFLSRLIDNLMDVSKRDSTRIASVCYLGSLLSRANYIPAHTAHTALSFVAKWLHQYITLQLDGGVVVPAAHSVFYAACQNLLYMLCYKLRALQETDRAFVQSLGLDALICCPLRPLNEVYASIVGEFVRGATLYQILSPAAQEEAVVANNRAAHEERSWGGAHRLDAFFPFDPYMLKLSSRHVDPIFRTWQRNGEGGGAAGVDDSASESEDGEIVRRSSIGNSKNGFSVVLGLSPTDANPLGNRCMPRGVLDVPEFAPMSFTPET
mmetsp:Transcript_8293/g.19110  ORF Transcript_8293/g.19110 Transcript_8293/m.19110 type:complete len:570 (-) Transcript_8293:280-1989(-)|eukprot:CAMPEP_0114544230 /NCGR_PEP_ID=MMETSP0114-20121206/2766_1 /TAXON_ID=31324 /ORGANISM="Goniomonas sp, Strain m" /LENGTH=569 /DNA_ID=CAMNT_0001728597 /DNA_START=41 /DNA_END=1750 /DNA_ORIENTATION=-